MMTTRSQKSRKGGEVSSPSQAFGLKSSVTPASSDKGITLEQMEKLLEEFELRLGKKIDQIFERRFGISEVRAEQLSNVRGEEVKVDLFTASKMVWNSAQDVEKRSEVKDEQSLVTMDIRVSLDSGFHLGIGACIKENGQEKGKLNNPPVKSEDNKEQASEEDIQPHEDYDYNEIDKDKDNGYHNIDEDVEEDNKDNDDYNDIMVPIRFKKGINGGAGNEGMAGHFKYRKKIKIVIKEKREKEKKNKEKGRCKYRYKSGKGRIFRDMG